MKHYKEFINRYTVRQYSEEIVTDELLRKIIEAAAHAPNTGNMQWYSVVITKNSENKKRLAPTHFNQPSVEGCSAVLTFCVDLSRFEKWCVINSATPGFDNFQSFVAAIIDTTIFAQQVNTIAELNGLGCCYLGTTAYNAPQIAEALNLPERVIPVTTLTIGYPAHEGKSSWRLPVDAIIHDEKYREFSDQCIKQYYEELEKDLSSVRFVEENGKESLAQVFTDVRYPKDSAEYFSKVYLELLKKNRFID